MLLEMFVIASVIFGGAAIVHFWDEIKDWLNTVAADAVEKTFGYNARQNMIKAIATVDRIVNKIRNTAVVYSKEKPTSTYFDKTTIKTETGIENVDAEVLKKLANNHNTLTQIFDYK